MKSLRLLEKIEKKKTSPQADNNAPKIFQRLKEVEKERLRKKD